jgi:hypothetical protein
MLSWRDLSAAAVIRCRRAGTPPKSGARVGGCSTVRPRRSCDSHYV